MAADEVARDDAALARRRVLEVEDDQAVAARTAPPALVAVLPPDAPFVEQLGVAGRADVVVALLARVAVVPALLRLDRVVADVAFRAEGQRPVLAGGFDVCGREGLHHVLGKERGEGGFGARVYVENFVVGTSGDVCDWKERVCAVSALVDAAIAVAPFTIVTGVAFPETVFGKALADIAKHPRLEALCGIALAPSWAKLAMLIVTSPWPTIAMSSESMGQLLISR